MIYSFDPGQVTGIAVGDNAGNLIKLKQVTFEELPAYLDELKQANLFIVEEFRIRPDKAMSFSFSDMKVIQAIGMIMMRAYQLEVRIRFQRPLDKTVGYKWAGKKPPTNHALSHQVDAYAHLVFYWVHVGGLEPPAMANLTPIDSVEKTL